MERQAHNHILAMYITMYSHVHQVHNHVQMNMYIWHNPIDAGRTVSVAELQFLNFHTYHPLQKTVSGSNIYIFISPSNGSKTHTLKKQDLIKHS